MSLLLGLGLAAILMPLNYLFFQMMKKSRIVQGIGLVMIMFGTGLIVTGLYIAAVFMYGTFSVPQFTLGLFISIMANLLFKIMYTFKQL